MITGDDDFFDEDDNIRPGKRPVTRNIACIPDEGLILFETNGGFYIGDHLSDALKRVIHPATENEILVYLNCTTYRKIKWEVVED